ncbi:MAG: GNAT family N-acetyltransferase [Coriobacteriales bacterium]|jgi:GNAT superfamily N-acetyltransferase
MHIVRKPIASELAEIKRIMGESFAGDNVFAAFDVDGRKRELVCAYMACYVDFAIACKKLYANEQGNGFVVLQRENISHPLREMKLERKLAAAIPADCLAGLNAFASEVADTSSRYRLNPHLELMNLCVDERCRGKGLGGEIVDCCKQEASRQGVPLVLDTDMPGNRDMYLHMGFELYRSFTATNGITRYNLVWLP